MGLADFQYLIDWVGAAKPMLKKWRKWVYACEKLYAWPMLYSRNNAKRIDSDITSSSAKSSEK